MVPAGDAAILDRCAAGGDGSSELAFLFDGPSKYVAISLVLDDLGLESVIFLTGLLVFLSGEDVDNAVSSSLDSTSWVPSKVVRSHVDPAGLSKKKIFNSM